MAIATKTKRIKLKAAQVKRLAALTGYDVDAAGLITTAGKFIGQPAYVVAAYCEYAEGFATKCGRGEWTAEFPKEFSEVVPAWNGREEVRFYIDAIGAVRECEG